MVGQARGAVAAGPGAPDARGETLRAGAEAIQPATPPKTKASSGTRSKRLGVREPLQPAPHLRPRRIISLAPSVTETLFAVGAGGAVVAISSHCDRPAAALDLPRSGTYLAPDVETILALEPDLVIGMPTPTNRAPVEQLRNLGIEVALVGEHTVADNLQAMRTIGRLTGHYEAAEALVTRVRTQLDAVRKSAATRAKVRTLLLVGREPAVAVGQGVYLDELLEIAGAENVARDAGGEWPRLSIETVAAAAPEIVIDTGMEVDGAGTDAFPVTGAWRAVAAVREHGFARLSGDALLRPGPRLGDAAAELFALLHDGDMARSVAEEPRP